MSLAAVPRDHREPAQLLPTLALHERVQLRTALRQRQRELTAALRLYEEVAIRSLPRMALIEQTARKIIEVGHALVLLDDHRYGTCAKCHRTIPIHTLTMRPLARQCSRCDSPA